MPDPALLAGDPEQRLDAFIVWLSRKDPAKPLPSRIKCRLILSEVDAEMVRSRGVPFTSPEEKAAP